MSQVGQHPWFGLGPDGFVFLELARPMDVVQPHQLLLQLALEWGLPGLVLTGILGAAGAHRLWTTRRRDGPALVGAKGAAIFGTIVILAISLVDGSLYHANSLMLAGCLVAVATGARARGREIRIGSGVAIAFAIGCLLVLGPHTAVVALQRGPTPEPGDRAVAIVRRFPSDVDRVHNWGRAWAREDPKLAVAWLHWSHDHARSRKAWKFYFLEGTLLRAAGFPLRGAAHLEHALRIAPTRKDRDVVRLWTRDAPREGGRSADADGYTAPASP